MADSIPVLGSLMQLISHVEIRYEGILADIDMDNSTITLSGGECLILTMVGEDLLRFSQ